MRFLVVDDEYLALNRLKALLKPYGECDAAIHANQACGMFRVALSTKRPYDLVTIDIDMPETSGTELLRLVREMEDAAGIRPAKIIMVSASSSYQNVYQSIAHKCDDFIVKPVEKEVLHNKLQALGLVEPDPPEWLHAKLAAVRAANRPT
jgi:two-component system chemotaxis response regulator CheY